MQCAAKGSGGSDGGAGDSGDDVPVGGDAAVEKSRVMFRLSHGVAFGEQIKVVGDGAELGNWDIKQAPSEQT